MCHPPVPCPPWLCVLLSFPLRKPFPALLSQFCVAPWEQPRQGDDEFWRDGNDFCQINKLTNLPFILHIQFPILAFSLPAVQKRHGKTGEGTREAGKGRRRLQERATFPSGKLLSISKPLKGLLKLQKGERRRRNSACTRSSPP